MRNLVLIATALLLGVGCSLFTEPYARVLRLRYLGADEADNRFVWHVMSGDTVRLEAESCEYITRRAASVEYRSCRPTTADFVADDGFTPVGSLNGVQRAEFVVGDTFTRQTGLRSGELIIDASNERELAAVRIVNFQVRRLFLEADSLVVGVGDTIALPLAGDRTDDGIERRLAELPAVSVLAKRGESSPVQIVRGGHRFPPLLGTGYDALPRGAEDFIQSALIFVAGRTVGRDTIEVRTRTRMLRVPVIVEP